MAVKIISTTILILLLVPLTTKSIFSYFFVNTIDYVAQMEVTALALDLTPLTQTMIHPDKGSQVVWKVQNKSVIPINLDFTATFLIDNTQIALLDTNHFAFSTSFDNTTWSEGSLTEKITLTPQQDLFIKLTFLDINEVLNRYQNQQIKTVLEVHGYQKESS